MHRYYIFSDSKVALNDFWCDEGNTEKIALKCECIISFRAHGFAEHKGESTAECYVEESRVRTWHREATKDSGGKQCSNVAPSTSYSSEMRK